MNTKLFKYLRKIGFPNDKYGTILFYAIIKFHVFLANVEIGNKNSVWNLPRGLTFTDSVKTIEMSPSCIEQCIWGISYWPISEAVVVYHFFVSLTSIAQTN